jgi:predicted HTH domain antitoxin
MTKKEFLGLRVEPEVLAMVNEVAREEQVDKTKAIKILVQIGWREMRLEKALEGHRRGEISLDKAAELTGLNVAQIMEEAARHGIKSDETLEEYLSGLELIR